MRKFLLIAFALCAFAIGASADMDMVKISITNVVTNAAAGTVVDYTDSSLPGGIHGTIENIVIDLSGAASPDIDIDIKTKAGNTGAARTLYSTDDQTADENVAPKQATKNTAGAAITNDGGKLALCGDQIRVQAYDANKASINLDIYIIYRK